MNLYEKLSPQLDSDKPDWRIEWASEQSLKELARATAAIDIQRARRNTEWRILNELAFPILRAAIVAGIVVEVKESK